VVEDATLKVGLTARPTRAWARRFRRVLALLDRSSGEWDAISLRADAITVTNLREGSEEKLLTCLRASSPRSRAVTLRTPDLATRNARSYAPVIGA
jgi:hypothetical protein